MADSSQVKPNLDTYATGFTAGAQGPIGLTTIFRPPTSCLDTVTYDGTSFWQGGLLQTGDQNCYPESFLDIFFSEYTPGICPHGWTTLAATPVSQLDGNIGTHAFCCPSGYYHSSTDKGFLQHACASVFGSPLTNVYSTSTKGEGPVPHDVKLITVDPKSVQSNTVYADIIGIHWAETDSQILRLMSETSSSSSVATSTTAAQTAHRTTSVVIPTTSPSSRSTPPPGSLSSGAEAGIGIGAVVGAIALALFAYLLWLRRRKSRNREGRAEADSTEIRGVSELVELEPEKEKSGPQQRTDMPSQVAHELPTDERRSELASDASTNRNTMWSSTAGTMSSRNPSQKQTTSYL
ncbi:MAG: hypothetical protein L6R40_007356 [Gallowayella cf. fulva]|nr:MAG: hypothetical protein L6R40_007356 [Xanthomendoza cf. fulva]